MSTLASNSPVLLDKANMSLQRVFESARKLGLPVVVTDPAGREPMVVLSLEQFEAMAGATDNVTEVSRPIPASKPLKPGRKDTDMPVVSGQTGLSSYENELPKSEDRPEPTLEEIQVPSQSNPEISLDERFYLEPLEDGSTG